MSPESVQLGIEEWMEDCRSLLRRIADGIADLQTEDGHDIGALDPSPRQLLTVEETAALLRIGRSATYEAARCGQIPSVRLGRRVLIPKRPLMRLLAGEPMHGE